MIERSGKIYYSVREFAEQAKVSNQAIYKKVDNQLSTYVIVVDNRKYIEKSALHDIYGIDIDNHVDNQKAEKEAAAVSDSEGQAAATKELIEMLKEEIKKKDQQIERLQLRLDHAQDLIADMAQKAQYITAADKTEKIMIKQQSKEDQEKIIESEAAENQSTEQKSKRKWFMFWKKA